MKGNKRKYFGTKDRPRLSVHISLNNIYAQIIDDISAKTLVSASTLDKELKEKKKGSDKKASSTGNNIEAAKVIGELVGKRASAKGVTFVVFDRGTRKYHGRVKALADAARAAGLKF